MATGHPAYCASELESRTAQDAWWFAFLIEKAQTRCNARMEFALLMLAVHSLMQDQIRDGPNSQRCVCSNEFRLV